MPVRRDERIGSKSSPFMFFSLLRTRLLDKVHAELENEPLLRAKSCPVGETGVTHESSVVDL